MKRQDLDKYNSDPQWDQMKDKLIWALCFIALMLVVALACALNG